MTAREDLAEVIRDGVDTWRTPLEAADAILKALKPQRAALDAVLALADTYTKEFTAHNEAESMLRAAAYAIRAKVNDALEGK